MKLTKERIEMEMSAAVRDGWLSARAAEEICRLVLLGLERDERAERIGRAVLEAVMAGNAGRLGTPSQTLDEMANEVDAAAYWLTTPGEVLRSIADALREEAGR